MLSRCHNRFVLSLIRSLVDFPIKIKFQKRRNVALFTLGRIRKNILGGHLWFSVYHVIVWVQDHTQCVCACVCVYM